MLNRKINIILIVLLMTKGMLLLGQSISIPTEGHKNSYGVSINGGVFIDKEAVFIGASTDYSRLIGEKWIINVSLCFDQEHSSSDDGSTAIVNTISPALALGYAISPRLAAADGRDLDVPCGSPVASTESGPSRPVVCNNDTTLSFSIPQPARSAGSMVTRSEQPADDSGPQPPRVSYVVLCGCDVICGGCEQTRSRVAHQRGTPCLTEAERPRDRCRNRRCPAGEHCDRDRRLRTRWSNGR